MTFFFSCTETCDTDNPIAVGGGLSVLGISTDRSVSARGPSPEGFGGVAVSLQGVMHSCVLNCQGFISEVSTYFLGSLEKVIFYRPEFRYNP